MAQAPAARRHLTRATPTPSGPSGPYLGQKAPGVMPEVFGPGFISVPGTFTGGITFSPDGNEIYFNRFTMDDLVNTIWVTRQVDGAWLTPAPFTPSQGGSSPFLTPDGQRMYFTSPIAVLESQIWFLDLTPSGWSQPSRLANPLSARPKASVSAAANGNLYFSQIETNMQGRFYMATWTNAGGFASPLLLPSTVNRFITNDFIFVAPDESYLVLGVVPAPDVQRLFVSFKGRDGGWQAPIELPSSINASNDLIQPRISPDGKYLFFTRNRISSSAIYWVDAQVVFELRPATKEVGA